MNVSEIVTKAAGKIASKSPTILTVMGVVGFGTTIAFAIKGTPRAAKIHNAHQVERHAIRNRKDDAPEIRKAVVRDIWDEAKELAPLYGPAAGMGAMTLACFLGASKIQADRQAAVMAAYSLSEKTLSTYQKKVIEKLGEDKHADILNETTEEIVRQDTAPEGALAIAEGLMRCYDNVTGRYFYSTREKIVAAESEINKRLLAETRVTLQEFYYEMGLEERFTLGEAMGWDISKPAFENSMLNVWFTPMLDDDKNPCLALNYHVLIFDRNA